MSNYPLYIVMTDLDYQTAVEDGENIKCLGPNPVDLYDEGDFCEAFGRTGIVSDCEFHDTVKKQLKAAEEIARFYGSDICYTHEDGTLEFYLTAAKQYAKNKLEKISSFLSDMTEAEYLDTGAYTLRTMIKTNACFVHPYLYSIESDITDPSYTMSMDDWMLDSLQYCKSIPKLRVTQTLWCKW